MTEQPLGDSFPFRVLSGTTAGAVVPDGQVVFARSPGAPAAGPSALAESFAAELDALREQARIDGFEQGRAEGLADAAVQVAVAVEQARTKAEATLAVEQARVEQTAAALSAAVTALEAAHGPSADEMAGTLALSAFALAETVIGREIAVVDVAARDALARALTLCPDDGPVIVRMHPADAPLVTEAVPVPASVTVVADPGVERGGALAQFGASEVDARISTALARAKTVLS